MPTTNPFDQASRYLLRRSGVTLLAWLLRVDVASLRFIRWLDTKLTLAGQPERVGDTIAHVLRLDHNSLPWAIPVEFQVEPDELMFGRMMVYEGMIWLQEKPSDLPGDRFCLQSVVVNLTGLGNCGRRMAWSPGAHPPLLPVEWNLTMLDATGVLEAIAAGTAPIYLLPFVSLMKRGGEAATIRRWLEIAGSEPDAYRRGDFAHVVVFAELTACRDPWKKALEGFNVRESVTVNEWKAEEAVKIILGVLEARFGALPEELRERIRTTRDLKVVEGWVPSVAKASSLNEFCEVAGL